MLNHWRQNIIQLNNNLQKYSFALKTRYTVYLIYLPQTDPIWFHELKGYDSLLETALTLVD